MSIIQEALKKVQNTPGHDARKKESPVVKKEFEEMVGAKPVSFVKQKKLANKFASKKALLGVSVIFVLLFLSAGLMLIKSVRPRKSGSGESWNTPSRAQEVVYKPKANFIAKNKKINPREPEFILNGIMRREDGFMAIINNSIVSEGDFVHGATVIRIDEQSVVLESKDAEITLSLK
jgi:hypothetical protein